MAWGKTRIYISPKISKKNPKKFLNELSNFVEIEISKTKKNSDIIVISEKELKNQVRAIKEEKEEGKAFIILCDNIKKILKFDTLLDELGSSNLVDVIPEKGWEKILPLLILKLLKLKDKQKKEGRSSFISGIKNKIENIQKTYFILGLVQITNFDFISAYFGDKLALEILEHIFHKLKEIVLENNTNGEDIETRRENKVGEIYRISDRKFGFILKTSAKTENEAYEKAKRLIKKLKSELNYHLKVDGRKIYVSSNGGVYIYFSSGHQNGQNILDILDILETTLYESTKLGSEEYLIANEIIEGIPKKLEVIRNISKAIEEKRIGVVFQPIYDLKDMKIKMFEVLLRWKGQDINPEDIIDIADASGTQSDLLDFILENTVDIMKSLRKYKFAINLTARAITEKRAYRILQILSNQGIPPTNLCLEISEKSNYEEIKAVKKNIELLHKAGVDIAIDDFGSAFSEIGLLYELPIKFIKIDGSVIKSLKEGDEKQNIIAEAVIYMATNLAKRVGAETIAEKIETKEELEIIKRLGIDYAQGFFLSYPLTQEELLQI
ncbi:MAG: EAL domain-containing protein [Candidatus Calescibacterium sp.]|nr:EAL domain-containing protein [Candidatus Calescibacterium sp.]